MVHCQFWWIWLLHFIQLTCMTSLTLSDRKQTDRYYIPQRHCAGVVDRRLCRRPLDHRSLNWSCPLTRSNGRSRNGWADHTETISGPRYRPCLWHTLRHCRLSPYWGNSVRKGTQYKSIQVKQLDNFFSVYDISFKNLL